MSVNPQVLFRVNGSYVDLTTYVLGIEGRNAIRIEYGEKDKAGKDSPIRITFKMFDPNGDLNTDNPYSIYYRAFNKGIAVKVIASGAVTIGELTKFHATWKRRNGSDTIIDVVVSSFSKRDTRSTSPLHSPLYRALSTAASLAQLVTYRPFEEESGATLFASPLSTDTGAVTVGDSVSIGSYTDHPGAVRMPTFQSGGYLFWTVPTHASTTAYRAYVSGFIPSAGIASAAPTILRLYFAGSGNTAFVDLTLNTGGSGVLGVAAYGPTGVIDSGASFAAAPYIHGRNFMLSLKVSQNGANLDVSVDVYNDISFGTSFSFGASDSLTGVTIGTLQYVGIGELFPGQPLTDASFGHVAVVGTATAFVPSDLFEPGGVVRPWRGLAGEAAGVRLKRLCDEAGITLDGPDLFSREFTEVMGVQRALAREVLIAECASTDGGILGQSRTADSPGYFYVPRHELYSTAPKFTLTYAAPTAHLAEDFASTDDDFALSNDVTVRRIDGVSIRSAFDTPDGYHFTTQDPTDDPDGIGVGNDTSEDMVLFEDSQTEPQAEWLVHLGAWREKRYASVTIDLLRSSVASDTDLVSAILDAYLGDTFEINMTGADVRWSAPDVISLMIRGGVEVIGQLQHTITFITKPALPWEVWQLDTSGSTIVYGVDSSSTAIRFVTSLGPEWETSELPYFVQIAGEALKVTAALTRTPAFVVLGTASSGNNATVNPGIPAGMVEGPGTPGQSTMICFAAVRPGSAGVQATPTGWTLLHDGGNIKVFGKYYVSGDTAPAITISGGAAGDDTYAVIAGCSYLSLHPAGGTKATPAHASQSNTAATNIAYPALPIERDNAMVFYFGARADDATSVAAIAGATELFDTALTAGTDMHVVADYVVQSTATDIAAGSFTVTTGGGTAVSRGAVIALRTVQSITIERAQNNISVPLPAGSAVNGWRMGVNAL